MNLGPLHFLIGVGDALQFLTIFQSIGFSTDSGHKG